LKTNLIATKAVNQYLTRDVFAYLGLRYYLANTAACTDDWAQTVAIEQLLLSSNADYLTVKHFKSASPKEIVTRPVLLPEPNEALAEAALLTECARQKEEWELGTHVYSYRMAEPSDPSGMFRYYSSGYAERGAAIQSACDGNPSAVVHFADIQSFYPSVQLEHATEAWKLNASRCRVPTRLIDTGLKILDGYRRAGHSTLPVGPMFVHLLANLVLRSVDERMMSISDVRYIRYVDDVALVGDQSSVLKAREMLQASLSELGLSLHDDTSPKHITVKADEWTNTSKYFKDPDHEVSWMTFVRDIKRFVALWPERSDELKQRLLENSLHVPLARYVAQSTERSYRERLSRLLKFRWISRLASDITPESISRDGIILRNHYEQESDKLLGAIRDTHGYKRGVAITRLRYRLSKLVSIGNRSFINERTKVVGAIPELGFHAEVMRAVSSGQIGRILEMGTNTAQSVAQVFVSSGEVVKSSLTRFREEHDQALAVFALNGVQVTERSKPVRDDFSILKFASNGVDVSLMRGDSSFIKQIACLHGLGPSRHKETMQTTFNQQENPMRLVINPGIEELSPT